MLLSIPDHLPLVVINGYGTSDKDHITLEVPEPEEFAAQPDITFRLLNAMQSLANHRDQTVHFTFKGISGSFFANPDHFPILITPTIPLEN